MPCGMGWLLPTVYVNHIISLNPPKCLVERDDYSPMNEHTENCIATVTHLENEWAENWIQPVWPQSLFRLSISSHNFLYLQGIVLSSTLFLIDLYLKIVFKTLHFSLFPESYSLLTILWKQTFTQ